MTKLCPRGKAAAKRKFKEYPSSYANAYASKICAGKIKDPSGTKRKDFRGPKPAGAKKGALMIIIGIGKKKKPVKARLGAAIGAIGAGAGAIGAAAARANKKFSDKAKAKKRDKMKVQKKMGGGMTAGSMSGMGRLQKARMMNKGGDSKIKKSIDPRKGLEFKKGTPRKGTSDHLNNPVVVRKANKGGDAKIKKVISGLHKASALHKGQAKSLQTVLKKSGGGMARGAGAAIRGNKFQGVF